jgi:DNA repair photolyase
MFKIKEIKSNSIITKSNLPETDYVINPYIGCAHSCVYCYARFMKRFTGHSEPWGQFVDVKINASNLIPTNTTKYRNKRILLSSVTDAYQPIEAKYKLTRKILKKLIPLQPKLSILTKSALIARDIDLLQQFQNCEIGLTITNLDKHVNQKVEPRTSPPLDKIKALQKLKSANLTTYVFIGPILPYLTDWKEIIFKTQAWTDFYMFENLNIKGTIWPTIKLWLRVNHPVLLSKYEKIYFTKNSYWNKVEKEIKEFCLQNKINGTTYFHH